MDHLLWKAAIEAQFLMGHCVPAGHMSMDRTTIVDWSWDVDIVRQQLHVPLNALWDERVLELEAQGLASFCLYSAPVTWDEQGNESVTPGWEDEPRENWGTVDISARGVLRLAELYGRPYVKLAESPALLAHWRLVLGESEARLHAPHNEAQWAREYPEKAAIWKAHQAELFRKMEESPEVQAWLADPQVQQWLEEIRRQWEQE